MENSYQQYKRLGYSAVNLFLPADLADKLREQAKREERPLQVVIRRIIKEYIEKSLPEKT